ncbi:hypothetical protein ACFPIJ_18680, partial [Dactylosporangium cerinum]
GKYDGGAGPYLALLPMHEQIEAECATWLIAYQSYCQWSNMRADRDGNDDSNCPNKPFSTMQRPCNAR